jgi:hypothetical protein
MSWACTPMSNNGVWVAADNQLALRGCGSGEQLEGGGGGVELGRDG